MADSAGPDGLVTELERALSGRGDITLRETSKSWLFFTSDSVFKLKKPIHDNFQDLSSLRARHDNTLTEIDLNRRIAPDLYRGAVRVGRGRHGRLVLDDRAAETVDWLVHMRRLPADRMLDARIIAAKDKADLAASIDQVADTLCAFYRRAPRSLLSSCELLTLREDQLAIARSVLLHPMFSWMQSRVEGAFAGDGKPDRRFRKESRRRK